MQSTLKERFDEKQVQCPQCGGLPTVQHNRDGSYTLFCNKHVSRYEAWGETFSEAEDAWIHYCRLMKSRQEKVDA